jgi:hypothetical protein
MITVLMTILKNDHQGITQLSYTGEVIGQGQNWICLQAPFTLGNRDLGYVQLNRGDLFTEWFYTDRWYNVFRVQDGHTGALKGWYCNITRPAEIAADHVAAEDLALDVFVTPKGELILLDEDEYAQLPLIEEERILVNDAIADIQRLVATRQAPFDWML